MNGTGRITAKTLTAGAMVAAAYFVLTFLAFGVNLAFGAVQVRFSEALCIMPVFCGSAIHGLFVGCLLSNLIMGAPIYDIIFGSLATLGAAILTRVIACKVRKPYDRLLVPLPAVVVNAVVIGLMQGYVYAVPVALPLLMLSVALGQTVACYGLGLILWYALDRINLQAMLQ